MPEDTNQNPLRKAAILLASLDPTTAERLLESLPTDDAARLRAEADSLSFVDPLERQAVLDEFRRSSGPHFALSNGHEPRARSLAILLEGVDAASIAALVEQEHPQTVAVVVSRLEAPRAAEVLAFLSPSLQADAMRRLATLGEPDESTLCQVERAIARRLEHSVRPGDTPAGGLSALANILHAAARPAARRLLANLSSHDQELARRLDTPPLAFDDLIALDDGSLRAVFVAAGDELVELAFAGATPEFAARIKSVLGNQRTSEIERSLASGGPLRISDLEDAQSELARIATELLDAGRIVAPRERSALNIAV